MFWSCSSCSLRLLLVNLPPDDLRSAITSLDLDRRRKVNEPLRRLVRDAFREGGAGEDILDLTESARGRRQWAGTESGGVVGDEWKATSDDGVSPNTRGRGL